MLSKRNESILWLAVLFLAALVRLAPIGASLPYIDYIDEGYVLHQTIHLLNKRALDTAWYGYPSLPAYLNAVALISWSPIYRQVHGHSFRRDLPREENAQTSSGYNYDLISPPELILAGRLITAALSIGTVFLAGVIAFRLRGGATGFLALLITALCPALVLRASNVIVDPFATFFGLLAIYLSGLIRPNERLIALPAAAAAGFAAGLAFASKYGAGAVFAAVLFVIWMSPVTMKSRLRLGFIACAGLLSGIGLGAPATFFHSQAVMHDVAITAGNYYVITSSPGYFGQAIGGLELGWPLAIAGAAGIVLMLRRRETRSAAIAWMIFAVVLLAPFVNRPFQPFRNLLPLVPPFCIAAAIAFSDVLDWAWEKRRPLLRAATLVLIGVCSATLALPLYRPIRQRMTHSDSRVQAIDWLQRHATREQSVLGIRELAILPAEWRRLGATATVLSLFDTSQNLESDHFDYIVTGDFDLRYAPDGAGVAASLERWKQKTASFVTAAEFGAGPAFVVPYLWRGNDERIVVLRSNTAKSAVTAESAR